MAEDKDCNGNRLHLKTPIGELVLSGKRNAEVIAVLALVVMGIQLYLVYSHVEASNIQARALYGALREMTCVLKIEPDKRGDSHKLCKQLGEMM